jgi:hypothetical protein
LLKIIFLKILDDCDVIRLNNFWLEFIFVRYIDDCVTREEALGMLRANQPFRAERESKILQDGFPAYTTQVIIS